MSRRIVVVLLGLAWLIQMSGCAPRLPPVVPAQGRVLLNGKPLPNASVTFVPLLDHFGAESNSNALTDENGQFTLTCAYGNQPGAVVAKHVVLIKEAPLPEELRNSHGGAIDRHHAELGNRPIPPEYGDFDKSPIKIEVKEGQSEYNIELIRR